MTPRLFAPVLALAAAPALTAIAGFAAGACSGEEEEDGQTFAPAPVLELIANPNYTAATGKPSEAVNIIVLGRNADGSPMNNVAVKLTTSIGSFQPMPTEVLEVQAALTAAAVTSLRLYPGSETGRATVMAQAAGVAPAVVDVEFRDPALVGSPTPPPEGHEGGVEGLEGDGGEFSIVRRSCDGKTNLMAIEYVDGQGKRYQFEGSPLFSQTVQLGGVGNTWAAGDFGLGLVDAMRSPGSFGGNLTISNPDGTLDTFERAGARFQIKSASFPDPNGTFPYQRRWAQGTDIEPAGPSYMELEIFNTTRQLRVETRPPADVGFYRIDEFERGDYHWPAKAHYEFESTFSENPKGVANAVPGAGAGCISFASPYTKAKFAADSLAWEESCAAAEVNRFEISMVSHLEPGQFTAFGFYSTKLAESFATVAHVPNDEGTANQVYKAAFIYDIFDYQGQVPAQFDKEITSAMVIVEYLCTTGTDADCGGGIEKAEIAFGQQQSFFSYVTNVNVGALFDVRDPTVDNFVEPGPRKILSFHDFTYRTTDLEGEHFDPTSLSQSARPGQFAYCIKVDATPDFVDENTFNAAVQGFLESYGPKDTATP